MFWLVPHNFLTHSVLQDLSNFLVLHIHWLPALLTQVPWKIQRNPKIKRELLPEDQTLQLLHPIDFLPSLRACPRKDAAIWSRWVHDPCQRSCEHSTTLSCFYCIHETLELVLVQSCKHLSRNENNKFWRRGPGIYLVRTVVNPWILRENLPECTAKIIYGTYVTLCLSQRSRQSSCSLRCKYGDKLPGINQGLAQPCAKSRAFNDRCDRCERCETHRNALETPRKTPCRGTCCRWSCLQTAGHRAHCSAHLKWDCFHWDVRCEMRGEPEKCDGFQATKQNTDPPEPRRSCCSCWTLQKLHAGDIYKQKLLWNHSQRLFCSLGTPRQIEETQILKATRLEMPNDWIHCKAKVFYWIQMTLKKTFRTVKS